VQNQLENVLMLLANIHSTKVSENHAANEVIDVEKDTVNMLHGRTLESFMNWAKMHKKVNFKMDGPHIVSRLPPPFVCLFCAPDISDSATTRRNVRTPRRSVSCFTASTTSN
jgi:hypothetical protein